MNVASRFLQTVSARVMAKLSWVETLRQLAAEIRAQKRLAKTAYRKHTHRPSGCT